MNEYTVIKLISGQDIICTIDKNKMTENLIEVNYPMLILINTRPNGVSMIYLKKYNILSKSHIMCMRREPIIGTYIPHLELVDYYKAYKKYNIEILDKLVAMELDLATKYTNSALTTYLSNPNYLDDLFSNMMGITKDDIDISKIKKTKTSKVH